MFKLAHKQPSAAKLKSSYTDSMPCFFICILGEYFHSFENSKRKKTNNCNSSCMGNDLMSVSSFKLLFLFSLLKLMFTIIIFSCFALCYFQLAGYDSNGNSSIPSLQWPYQISQSYNRKQVNEKVIKIRFFEYKWLHVCNIFMYEIKMKAKLRWQLLGMDGSLARITSNESKKKHIFKNGEKIVKGIATFPICRVTFCIAQAAFVLVCEQNGR